MELENRKLWDEIKVYEMPMKPRDSHIRRPGNRFMGDSIFTNRMPSIIGANRTLIGTKSVLYGDRLPTSNARVKSSRGFCSLFGFGGAPKNNKKG